MGFRAHIAIGQVHLHVTLFITDKSKLRVSDENIIVIYETWLYTSLKFLDNFMCDKKTSSAYFHIYWLAKISITLIYTYTFNLCMEHVTVYNVKNRHVKFSLT